MDWMKIAYAAIFGMMIIVLFPRAREMVKNSPKGSHRDWMTAVIPLAFVVGFVVLLAVLV